MKYLQFRAYTNADNGDTIIIHNGKLYPFFISTGASAYAQCFDIVMNMIAFIVETGDVDYVTMTHYPMDDYDLVMSISVPWNEEQNHD